MGDAWHVCSIAGYGNPGHLDGKRRICKMNCPSGIALDQQEGIWISDRHNHCVRRLPSMHEKTPVGREDDMYTVCGRPRKAGFQNGRLRESMFNGPAGICCGGDGAMYVVDRENHCVRRISGYNGADSYVTSVCGSESSESGWRDGAAAQALFNRPFGIACAPGGQDFYIADTGNNSIRKLSGSSQTVSTILGAGVAVGSGEQPLQSPMGVAVDGSNCIYISEWGAHRIRRINPDGTTVIVAGSGTKGSLDGRGVSAQMCQPCGMTVDSKGVVYIADWGNHSIRRMTQSGDVTTIGRGGIVIVDDGERYVTSTLGCLDGPGTFAAFNSPQDVCADSYGDVFVADWGNHSVRKMETVATT